VLINVTKITPGGLRWAQVNTDLVEDVRERDGGGLVLLMQDGREIDINEGRTWWEAAATKAQQ
jgi:hypothetical protein